MARVSDVLSFSSTDVKSNIYLYSTLVPNAQNTGGDLIGYRSTLETTDNIGGGNTYNIYAGGTAPNYFNGPILAGLADPAHYENKLGGGTKTNFYATAGSSGVDGGAIQVMGIDGGNGKNRVYMTFAASIYSTGRDAVRTGYITSIDRTGCRFISSDGSPVRIVADTNTATNATALSFNASNLIKLLQPKQFELNGRSQLGFLAPELKAHVPLAVEESSDEEGGPVREGYDPLQLIPVLTKALQEALGKIETLEQRLSDAGIA